MTNEEYWARRNTELEAAWHRKSRQEIEKELLDFYARALHHIESDIRVLYARFANDNGLDMVEAQRLLMGQEYRTWRMDIEDYIKEIQTNGDNELLRELNTLAMRSRITRLDKLYADTLVEVGKLSKDVRAAMDKFLPSAYKDFYYHDLYDIGQKRGLIHSVSRVDAETLENVIRMPWSGKNYSARIWKNGEKLAETIQRTVTAGMHRGCSVDELARYVKQRMNVGYSQAVRLVRTELNYVQNRAILDGIKESGMKYYRFVATLDRRTSTVCRDHDGQTFKVEDYAPGTNAPPLHPHCRSTIVGSIKGDSKPRGERAARDESGKYTRVPGDMTYADWHKIYVEKTMTLGDWKLKNGGRSGKINQKENASDAYKELVSFIKKTGVEYNEVKTLKETLVDDAIIRRVGGGDLTSGSCSSLALAYAGNMNGLDVLDFRGGESRYVFAIKWTIERICNLASVKSKIESVSKEIAGTIKVLRDLEDGKQYYLATGKHAAIVRSQHGILEYLELQSGDPAYKNGWHKFTEWGTTQEALKKRFGCRKTVGGKVFLIDIDSLANNQEFLDILGYINTDEKHQIKGAGGSAK